MSPGEIDELLRVNETGVLALADEDEAYAIPLAYHSDGTSLYFRLVDTPNSTKMSFLDETTTARFLVYDVDPPEHSWSILLTGSVRLVDEDESVPSNLGDKFITYRRFDEQPETLEPVLAEFVIEELSGRRTAYNE